MKRYLLIAATTALCLFSCTEKIDDSARYVFDEYTVASYLETHEIYSSFVDLSKKVRISDASETSVFQVLSARGNYTCFAPTNEAIDQYLNELVEKGMIDSASWDAFTDEFKLDSVRKVVVLNSIIDGKDEEENLVYTTSFVSEKDNTKITLDIANMKERRLTYYKEKGRWYISGSKVDSLNIDIKVINGVVHRIHNVISPKEITAYTYLKDITDQNQATGFLMFAKAVFACGLEDTLMATRDYVYEKLVKTGEVSDFKNYMSLYPSDMTATAQYPDATVPLHRDYGFTMFVEKDSFWINNGIDPTSPDALEKLQQWIVKNGQYPDEASYSIDENYTDMNNMLHQWVTYHILPMKLDQNQLVYHCNELGYSLAKPNRITLPCPEWYPCFSSDIKNGSDRRLLKLYDSDKSNGIYVNRFANRNNGRKDDGYERDCDPDKVGCKILTDDSLAQQGEAIMNACIYPIDAPLAYTEATRQNLHKERIRFDGMALFPEAATNKIRRSKNKAENHIYIPPTTVYQYFDNMDIITEDTRFVYFNGHGYVWPLFSQDEMKAIGHYDIMFTLPPVPVTDTYELRYKILSTGVRGVVQVYFGDDPDNLPVAGIPIDLRNNIDFYIDGGAWEDTGDEDKDSELDRELRNHNIMKSGRHETAGSATTRETVNNIRYIVARQTMYPNKRYYVRFKSVLDSDKTEFHLDYFELCPKTVYDNPNDPEDIW